jgi:hypothetical protein
MMAWTARPGRNVMSNEQLEQRLAAVEKTLADLQQQIHAIVNGAIPPTQRWQPRPMTPGEEEAFQIMMEHIRQAREEDRARLDAEFGDGGQGSS